MTTREIGGRELELSNLDKVLWPDDGVTKGDLVDHLVDVAELMLPHVAGRPLTLLRAPDGIDGRTWFQKDAADQVPDWVRTAQLDPYEDADAAHVVADDAATLALLGQLGAVELHVGTSPVDDLDHPAEVVFDLDPDGRHDREVRRTARWVHDLLTDELDLPCGVKASGSKGFHVHVPLDGSDDVETVRTFARDVAELLADRHDDALTTAQRKDRRDGRIFVDWLRNHPAQTAVVPYGVRARPGAPVAVPLDWDELSDGVAPDQYSIAGVRRRLAQRDDPWRDLRQHARALGEAIGSLAELDR